MVDDRRRTTDRSSGGTSAPTPQRGPDAASDRQRAAALPGITLPKGGGAVKGIDEKLTVGLATGASQLNVPVPVTPGRQGFGPSLSLSYDSGGGNGVFGLGWRLSVPSITRKTSRGLPRYRDAEDSDVFVLSDAEDLVPLPDAPLPDPGGHFMVRRYRPRVEAVFARVERWQAIAGGDVHWRTITRDNVTSVFGADTSSRVVEPGNPAHVFTWLLSLSYDDRGNAVAYEYKREDTTGVPHVMGEGGRVATANLHLKRIHYGNATPFRPAVDPTPPAVWRFHVVVDYGDHDLAAPQLAESAAWPCRADSFSSYRSTFEIRTHRLCRRILVFHSFPDELPAADVLVHSTDLAYTTDAPGDPTLPVYSLLSSVTQTGYVFDAATGTYHTKQLPPLQLSWSPVAVHDTVRVAAEDVVANLPAGVDGRRWRWTDLDGEGLQGVLAEDDGAWYYKRNVSAYAPDGSPPAARFEPVAVVAHKPVGPGTGSPQLADLHGDGRLCAVEMAPPAAGYFARDGDEWAPFTPFPTTAAIDWSSPDVRTVDLDGDGLADVLLTEDDAFTWYRWLAEDGFGPPQRVATTYDEDAGPALVLNQGDSSVYLADMSGDGLSDLVRIRNGEVCYWPNLGYGRFGAKVAMDGAPWFDAPDSFDAKRVRLADVDGSGTADIVYLAARGPSVHFNRSGNGFADAVTLHDFPAVDDVASLVTLDLLGAGTTCLVWSSPLPGDGGQQLRYVDLMGGVKPHLLVGVVNNTGAETSLTYATSTRFYLQDRLAGRPWATRLAFPVQVVARQEVRERVTGTRLVSSYSYHHGHFDGVEREFRGFGMVEQVDAEAVPAASGAGTFSSTPSIAGAEFALPPVRTRTWFHTGAYIGGEDIATVLSRDYFVGDAQAAHLQATRFDGATTPEEMREACRALRGRVLRTEVYADDGAPQANVPYAVTQHRYQVRLLQAPTKLSYGSVHASDLETLSYHYERNVLDPRVSHQLALEVDAYGTAIKSASTGYARRTAGAVSEQDATPVTYTERDVANVVDQPAWYRLGVPVEVRTYELTGLGAHTDAALLDPDTLHGQAVAAATIAVEVAPGVGIEKRLIGRTRTVYRADDLSGPLPLMTIGSLALVDRSYTLTMTAGLATSIYAPKVAGVTAIATTQGGYADLDGDGSWWAPSPRLFYSADPVNPDIAFARQHFFLPQGHVDCFGNVSRIAWEHDLVVVQSTDPVGNVTSASVNYRLMQPWLMTDPNLNRSGVRVDALGMVVATAQMGKALPGGADEGDHLDVTTPEPSATDDPTTRVDYGLDAYSTWAADVAHDPDRPTPVFVHTRARVRHKDAATPWLETYAYSDGLGRAVLTKAQAEPGDAPVVAAGKLTLVHTDSRWVGTGRVVNDNKANPVKAYEPFFDTTPAYTAEPLLVLTGVTAITRYDPLSRPVRVDKPNGTFTGVEFDPWRQLAADENDTVLDSEWYTARIGGALGGDQQDAATKAAAHAHTPLVSDVDTLGRVCHTIADGVAGQFSTHTVLDIQGRVLATVDALGRTVMSTDYDVSGGTVHTSSVDAGERWTLLDATGKPLRSWDSRGHEVRHTYDAARRPLGVSVSDGGGALRLVESALYGEGQPGDVAANLRGTVYEQRDGAGLLTNAHRDFKGNLLEVRRQVLDDVRADVDWSGASPLAPETFTTATTYDALNRTVTVTTPDSSVTTHTYNQRSLLDGVTVALHGAGAPTTYVNAVAYDAKAQRQMIAYGSGAVSTFSYDPQTFRLVHLVTTRPAGGSPVQDLTYTHDPVGNITRVADAAQSTIFFANQLVAPTGDYTYDTIYRLTHAAGREHIGQSASAPATWDDADRRAVPLPTDPQAMRNYTEAYTYDLVGNIATVVHTNAGGGWTRSYSYDAPNVPPHNNRLSSTTIGATTELYGHDAAGNMVAMPHLSLLSWDFKDQLQTTARQVVAGGDPRTTWYRYDAGAGRLRKSTVTAAGAVAHERIYQGDYEVYREYSPLHAVTLERQTLIVRGPGGMLAMIETTTVDAAQPGAVPATATRYQHGNHAGSACVELDENAAVITYEEYYPYGATSFQAGRSAAEVSLKRYRFAGKERDEESSLGCHGARYYAAWIGRWTSADPAGLVDGAGLYTYCRDNPVILHDPTGTQGTTADQGADDTPRFHFEPAAPPADGRPGPGIRLVYDRPVFHYQLQLPAYTPPPPPPVVAPADPQPINPIQVYQPAPTSDFRLANASVAAGGSTLGVGSSLLAFAFAYGLPKAGPFSFEAVLGITGTGDTTGALSAGSVSGGAHATLNTEDSRHNFTAYLTFVQTFGQSPPWATTPRNLGGALALGYEYHIGGPSNDYPRVALGANVSGATGESASISPASTTTGPTASLAPALSAGAVANVTVNLGYYSQPGTPFGISKVPAVSLLAEGFYNYASGGSALTPPGGTAGATGSTSSGGFNIGGLYNLRLDGGRSVFSAGATFGPRFQTDQVGPLTFHSSGVFVGGVVGAAF